MPHDMKPKTDHAACGRQKEADFYGAMDGASHSSWEATLCRLVILAVNLGGFFVV